jgi:phage major head subunit gpT-like protein
MRTVSLVSLLILAAVLLAGCTATKMSSSEKIYETPIAVDAHYEEGIDFSQYKTWTWIPSAGNATGSDRLDDPEFRDVVGTAVQKELYARGYAKTSENPDLVVNGFVSVQKIDKKYIEENFDGVYTPDYHAALPEGGSDKSSWEEGTLMLFIYDASKGQVVWYGTAQTETAKHAVDGMWQKRVADIVAQLLDSLPSRAQ